MRFSLPLVTVLVVGCGPGVHDLTFTGKPFASIRGHVDRALLNPVFGGPLYGALAWAARPSVDPVCELPTTNSRIAEVCRDPRAFVFAGIHDTTVARLDASGDFELPLRVLPDFVSTFGPLGSRIAYGSAVVFELNGLDPNAPEPELITLDPFTALTVSIPLASSYFDADAPQQRVVFREGGFDHEGNFFPFRVCPEPPSGFSILDYDPVASTCASTDMAATIFPEPLTVEQSMAWRCIRFGPSFILMPDLVQPENGSLECVNEDVLLHLFADGCDEYEVMSLTGCEWSLTCENPDWDLRAAPPEWWSCP